MLGVCEIEALNDSCPHNSDELILKHTIPKIKDSFSQCDHKQFHLILYGIYVNFFNCEGRFQPLTQGIDAHKEHKQNAINQQDGIYGSTEVYIGLKLS